MALAVHGHLVLRDRARLEPLDHDDRVVMALDSERARTRAEYLYLASTACLDPDSRLRLPDITQQRTQHQRRRRTGLASRLTGRPSPYPMHAPNELRVEPLS